MTTVINIRSLSSTQQRMLRDHTLLNHVYIGRAGHGSDGTFGNPFPLGPHEARGATLARYREHLWSRINADSPEYAREFTLAVRGLHGRVLVCFCKPAACHGDILAAAAAWLNERTHR